MADYDVDKLRAYIKQRAAQIGIDPITAVRVAQSEGLGRGIWQAQGGKGTKRGQEPSYGPWQFLVGGGDTGWPEGLGNRYMEKTGLNPRDPANIYSMTDFALNQAKNNGWADWYGARDNGIGRWEGISNRGQGGLTLNSSPINAASAIHPEIDPTGPSIAGVGSWAPGVARMDGPKGAEVDMGQFPPAPNASFIDNLKGAFKDPKSNLMSALTGFMGKAGGGGNEIPSTPIQSTLPSMEAADAARTQGAAQLMATLLAKKRKPMGLTLNSGMM